MAKSFLDTGVLVAAADRADPARRERARMVIRDLLREGQAVVSTQVLQEFFLAATRRLGIAPLVAKALVRDLARCEVVTIDPAHLLDAIDASVLEEVPLPDALIIAAARSAHCTEILSDGTLAGRVFQGIAIVNPLLGDLVSRAEPVPRRARRRKRRRKAGHAERPAPIEPIRGPFLPELGLEP
jgi:predicted nucleic acid-binding protein